MAGEVTPRKISPLYVLCDCGGEGLPLPSGGYECSVCGRTFTLERKPVEAPKP